MSFISTPSLDALVPPLSLLRAIQPNNMIFIHRGQTRVELANALSSIVNTPIPNSCRIWLLASEVEVILTFVVCSIMLYKKKALGKLWIFTRRVSRGGTFYVANAVFVLTLGVSCYLVAWDTFAVVIAGFSFAHKSVLEWLWVIPLPWLPLVIGAYVSIHGFAVGCSPRSSLSRINPNNAASRSKWYYVGIPKSAAVVNAVLIVPCVVFTGSTIALVGISGYTYYRAKHSAQHMLPPDLLEFIAKSASGKPIPLADSHVLASDELVWLARTVAANYMQVVRYVCLNLAVFAASAFGLLIPCFVYGIPNIISLVDHTCSRYAEPLPATCTSSLRKMWFLISTGRPRSHHSSVLINHETWKMTILAIGYISILIVCVPAYAWLPVYIVGDIFPHRMLSGDLGPPIYHAALSVSVISLVSCTFVALFCTVATLDPLFRAAIGLNIIRMQIPIDIQVEFHRSEHREHESASSTSAGGFLTSKGKVYDGRAKIPTITVKQSMSSVGTAVDRSPASAKFPDEPEGPDVITSTFDIEAGRPPRD
ncbi:hypothetical protein EX895_001578 [Sporisorium graminicola]|uniref:Dik6, novel virulence factor n=1 Tax=Sporisorium graminicola TaxID=280036 RepID=A0A4U7KXR0_9BASI|nr:hypothetical protein EX895_001578 [Sporisorium graminicola]TKY89047.1 hypothetical protein EX895_001578 [Sporisorium graminicola]